MRGERQVRRTTQYGEIFMRRVSPSSPCRDLLPACGEKGAVIRPESFRFSLKRENAPVHSFAEFRAPTSKPPSPRKRGEGEDEGRAPGSANHTTRRDFHAPRQPLIPLPGPSPRARGEGSRQPARALPLFVNRGNAPIHSFAEFRAPTSKPPSPRKRGQGEDEGRAPGSANHTIRRDFHAPRQPLIPLPGPSPRLRGEGSRHPARALLLFLELLVL